MHDPIALRLYELYFRESTFRGSTVYRLQHLCMVKSHNFKKQLLYAKEPKIRGGWTGIISHVTRL